MVVLLIVRDGAGSKWEGIQYEQLTEKQSRGMKELTDYIPLLTFLKVEKTKHENFNFVHLLSLSGTHISKSIRCMQILYIPNNCSTTGHLPSSDLGWHMSYDW